MVFCRGCGKDIHETAISCPSCGAPQRTTPVRGGKDKIVAGILALLLGGIGVHRFYLGQARGILYLLFCWTFIPAFIALIEAIVFFVTSDDNWNRKYGPS